MKDYLKSKTFQGFSILSLLLCLILFLFTACSISDATPPPASAQKQEQMTLEESQKELIANQPAPIMTYSLERENIKKRLERFNDPNKISYFYELSDNGQVITFFPVKGKISSVNSYMTTNDQIICQGSRFGTSESRGSDYQCLTMEAPDSDGTYGTNGEAVFGFTTEDVYFEWNGKYQLFDQPLQLTSTPILIYTQVITK